MFNGFSDRTLEFFMSIRFNNNTTFFHENHDWYEEAVRRPLKELAASLGPVIELADPRMERRPEKCVSRINRDIRFSHDKSPYRDYMWLSFGLPKTERGDMPGFYFEISADGIAYGMGMYDENRPMMNGLRRRLLSGDRTLFELLKPLDGDFALHARSFKRMKLPESLSDEAKVWYPLRAFYAEKEPPLDLAFSAALTDELSEGFRRLTPLYQYFAAIDPVDEPAAQ